MQEHHKQPVAVTVTIGFAARESGKGTAFVACGDDPATNVLRVPFSLTLRPALQGRDVAYAATNAVAEALLARGLRSVILGVPDERLAIDLAERRTIPAPLTVPYVALRCRLNRFALARVERASGPMARDLTNRAQAEVSIDIAA